VSAPSYGRGMKTHRTYKAGLPLLALAVALTASACGGKTVTVPGDMVGCVYSGVQSGSQFKRSIQPGQHINVGQSDELVLLPTGDQIYNVSTSTSRTEQAPSRVLAFTSGQTAVWVEGVLKFRFNTAGDKACKWYSKYGLQSTSFGDLGFAVTTKSGVPQKRTGWFRFLAEAQGDTMKQVVHDGSSGYTWQQLAYGSDPTLKTKPSSEPISIGYGRHIGSMLTKYLTLNLGDSYFCGVQPGLSGVGETSGCPPLYFQILSVYPRDKALSDEHEKLKELDAELSRQRQAAKLKAMNRATAIASARAQRKVLEVQVLNTRLEARNDLRIQKCLILAKVNLDCDGHKQQIVVAGAGAPAK
jgi:hypothetical protein